MAFTFSGGASGGILTPQPTANAITDNYIDIVTLGGNKLLPDYYDNLVERFGNQSIQGFLAKTSAEFPLKSDLIEWHEEGRIALYYESVTASTSSDAAYDVVLTLKSPDTHAMRVGQVVLIDDGGEESLGRIVSVASDNTSANVALYQADTIDKGENKCTVRVIGSEFAKGTSGMVGSIETQTTNYSNRPTILKDKYAINGSDTAQIGWIKVEGGAESSPFGAGGWLWYLKSEMDNRERFMDLLETQALEIRKSTDEATKLGNEFGRTEGVFESLENRAINTDNAFDGSSFDKFRDDIDALLKELDKQGAIQENLIYLNRDQSLAIDNGLALANSYGADGQSYGAFNNSSDMALNLGFRSWHRGSYTFHKTDWKYLNQIDGRGSFTTGVTGLLAPSGSMNVYDQGIGGTAKRPFIHVRYKASQTDNRKMKHWITGSVGAATSDLDAMEIHYLSERCTVVQGANNFVLFKTNTAADGV